MRRHPASIGVVALVLLSGCGSEIASEADDSLLDQEPRGTYARIGDFDLSLGGVEARGPELFAQVDHVASDGAGRIWVFEAGANEVRVFDADGRHLVSFGGTGDGPGEFRRLRFLGLREDEVILGDDRVARVTRFDLDGRLLSAERVGDALATAQLRGVLPDGSLWGQAPVTITQDGLTPGQLLDDESSFFIASDLADAPDIVGSAPTGSFIWSGPGMVAMPFTVNPGYASLGNRVHVTSGTSPRTRVLGGGEGPGEYGVERPPAPTSRLAEEYRAFVAEFIPAELMDAYLQALEHPALPEHAPVYAQLVAAGGDQMWARRWSPNPLSEGAWDVFDAGGVHLGTVRTPKRLRVLSVYDESLLGTWFDDFGVQHVRRYPVVRVGGT